MDHGQFLSNDVFTNIDSITTSQTAFFQNFLIEILTSSRSCNASEVVEKITPTLLALHAIFEHGWRPNDERKLSSILTSLLELFCARADLLRLHTHSIFAVKQLVSTSAACDGRFTIFVVNSLASFLNHDNSIVVVDIFAAIVAKLRDLRTISSESTLKSVDVGAAVDDLAVDEVASNECVESLSPAPLIELWRTNLTLGSVVEVLLSKDDTAERWERAEVVRINRLQNAIKVELSSADCRGMKSLSLTSGEMRCPATASQSVVPVAASRLPDPLEDANDPQPLGRVHEGHRCVFPIGCAHPPPHRATHDGRNERWSCCDQPVQLGDPLCPAAFTASTPLHPHGLRTIDGSRLHLARCDVCKAKGCCLYMCSDCDWDICGSCFAAEAAASLKSARRRGGTRISKGKVPAGDTNYAHAHPNSTESSFNKKKLDFQDEITSLVIGALPDVEETDTMELIGQFLAAAVLHIQAQAQAQTVPSNAIERDHEPHTGSNSSTAKPSPLTVPSGDDHSSANTAVSAAASSLLSSALALFSRTLDTPPQPRLHKRGPKQSHLQGLKWPLPPIDAKFHQSAPAFYFFNHHKSVVFPDGPVTLFSDECVFLWRQSPHSPGGTSALAPKEATPHWRDRKVQWIFRASGNGVWCVGVVSETDRRDGGKDRDRDRRDPSKSTPMSTNPLALIHPQAMRTSNVADFLLRRGTIGVANSVVTRTELPLVPMHEKIVKAVVDPARQMLKVVVDGRVCKRIQIPTSSFPLRLAICGHRGTRIDSVPSTNVGEKPGDKKSSLLGPFGPFHNLACPLRGRRRSSGSTDFSDDGRAGTGSGAGVVTNEEQAEVDSDDDDGGDDNDDKNRKEPWERQPNICASNGNESGSGEGNEVIETSEDFVASCAFETFIAAALDALFAPSAAVKGSVDDTWDAPSPRHHSHHHRSSDGDEVNSPSSTSSDSLPPTNEFDCARRALLSIASNASYRSLLADQFCVPLLSHCATSCLDAVDAAIAEYSSKRQFLLSENIDAVMHLIDQVRGIEDQHRKILVGCLPSNISEIVHPKVSEVVQASAMDRLLSFVLIENEASDFGFHAVMKEHLMLSGSNRFGAQNADLIHAICLSAEGKDKFEEKVLAAWERAIDDVFDEECAQLAIVNLQTSDVVERLVELLKRARDISTVELAAIPSCLLAPDRVFNARSRQLKYDAFVELSKALAVSLSSLLDTHSCLLQRSKWASKVSVTVDVINMVVNSTAHEFGHFYRLLLARRLLRGRFSSIEDEEAILARLPAMTRVQSMLDDVKSTRAVMVAFRRQLLKRSNALRGSGVDRLFSDVDAFQINVISRAVWNSSWVSTEAYRGLKLPPLMKTVVDEFTQFFRTQRLFGAHNSEEEDVKRIKAIKEIEINVSSGESSKQNLLTDDMSQFWRTAGQVDGRHWVEVTIPAKKTFKELLLFTTDFESYSPRECVIYVGLDSASLSPVKKLELGRASQWNSIVRAEEVKGAGISPPRVVRLEIRNNHSGGHDSKVAQIKLLTLDKGMQKRPTPVWDVPLRPVSPGGYCTLGWCHGTGAATLQAQVADGSSVFLVVNEPQCAVLCALNHVDSDSAANLARSTGLSLAELDTVVTALTSPEICVLEISQTDTDFGLETFDGGSLFLSESTIVKLSRSFLLGDVGSRDEDAPSFIPSIAHHDDGVAGQGTAHVAALTFKWRNELIDAAILRVLKNAARAPSFSAPSSPPISKTSATLDVDEVVKSLNLLRVKRSGSGPSPSGMPLDILLNAVRLSTKRHLDVSTIDIMKRAEHLVTSEFIYKTKSSEGNFRNFVYHYLPLEDSGPTQVSTHPLDSFDRKPEWKFDDDDEDGTQESLSSRSSSFSIPKSLSSDTIAGDSKPPAEAEAEPSRNSGGAKRRRPLSYRKRLQRTSSKWAALALRGEGDQPAPIGTITLDKIEEAASDLDDTITQVMDVLNEQYSATIALLQHFRWDVQTLLEAYLDSPRRVRHLAGLAPHDGPGFYRGLDSIPIHSRVIGHRTPTCKICLSDCDPSLMFASHCKHFACRSCLGTQIGLAIAESAPKIACFCSNTVGCKAVLTIDLIDLILGSTGEESCKTWLLRTFIDSRAGSASYCKNPKGCTGIVLLNDDAELLSASCSSCGSSFCTLCDMPAHAPAACHMLQTWIERDGYVDGVSNEEMLTRKTKLLTTSPCPRCRARIEKDQGCVAMHCRGCNYEFCWGCRRPAHSHAATCDALPIKEATFDFDRHNAACALHFGKRTEMVNELAKLPFAKSVANSTSALTDMLTKGDGLRLLADCHAALAFSHIVANTTKSDKLDFIIDDFTARVERVSKVLHVIWDGSTVALAESADIKRAVRHLSEALRDHFILVRTETFSEAASIESPDPAQPRPTTPVIDSSPSSSTTALLSPPPFGPPFGTTFGAPSFNEIRPTQGMGFGAQSMAISVANTFQSPGRRRSGGGTRDGRGFGLWPAFAHSLGAFRSAPSPTLAALRELRRPSGGDGTWTASSSVSPSSIHSPKSASSLSPPSRP